jgi:hypothetical protein
VTTYLQVLIICSTDSLSKRVNLERSHVGAGHAGGAGLDGSAIYFLHPLVKTSLVNEHYFLDH